ncbi:MAG: hypothetical protein QOF62_862 [Pyrinomonadaceae bacterium]|jgi:hypothetical protein|nr:hypothetical protein [Pyrinomonadaceae bacterium]
MLTETFSSIVAAVRKVFANWRALLLVAIVYVALLVALYFFVAVREASVAQVALTFALALLAPILFFMLQAMIANGFSDAAEPLSAGLVAKRSLTGFWKFIVITLPLIALAILVVYLLAKYQSHLASVPDSATQLHPMAASSRSHETTRAAINWKGAALSTIRYLALGLVLPLAAIHLWLATARDGLVTALKRIGQLLARAFAPQSILIYVVGFLIFAIAPYFLLFRTTPNKHAWLDLILLGVRVAAVFSLTLLGWVITVKAIALLTAKSSEPVTNEAG